MSRRKNYIDERIEALVNKIDAEIVTVSLSYDKNSFWRQRGRTERAAMHYDVEIEWDDHNGSVRFDGDVHGGGFAAVLDRVEAQIDGHLLRTRVDQDV